MTLGLANSLINSGFPRYWIGFSPLSNNSVNIYVPHKYSNHFTCHSQCLQLLQIGGKFTGKCPNFSAESKMTFLKVAGFIFFSSHFERLNLVELFSFLQNCPFMLKVH